MRQRRTRPPEVYPPLAGESTPDRACNAQTEYAKETIKCRTPGLKSYPVPSSVSGATGNSLRKIPESSPSMTMRPYVRPAKRKKKNGMITKKCQKRPSVNVLLTPKCSGVIPRDIVIIISTHLHAEQNFRFYLTGGYPLAKKSTSLDYHPYDPLPGIRSHPSVPFRHQIAISLRLQRFVRPAPRCGHPQSHRNRYGK